MPFRKTQRIVVPSIETFDDNWDVLFGPYYAREGLSVYIDLYLAILAGNWDQILEMMGYEEKDPNIGEYGVLVYSKWDKRPRETAYYVPARDCSSCLEYRSSDLFPDFKITPGCQHHAETCLDCLQGCLQARLDHERTCPECLEPLFFEDIKRWSSPETFMKYILPISILTH